MPQKTIALQDIEERRISTPKRRRILDQVAKKSQTEDISSLVRFHKAKQSVKNIAVCDKWAALDSC
jgi:hypothetical protein